jgi:flagellar biosynthesis/type III secretory pathway protein FliH
LRTGTAPVLPDVKFQEAMQEKYREGYEAGQKALAEQLVEQRKQLIDIQNGLLRSIQAALPGVVAECEKSVVLLAMESARKVVESIPITGEMMESVVRKALTQLQDTAEYEVLLHPEDLALLEQLSSGLLPRSNDTKVRFGIDAGVTRGGCVIKTNHGAITAIRERMFDKLEAAVLG